MVNLQRQATHEHDPPPAPKKNALCLIRAPPRASVQTAPGRLLLSWTLDQSPQPLAAQLRQKTPQPSLWVRWDTPATCPRFCPTRENGKVPRCDYVPLFPLGGNPGVRTAPTFWRDNASVLGAHQIWLGWGWVGKHRIIALKPSKVTI